MDFFREIIFTKFFVKLISRKFSWVHYPKEIPFLPKVFCLGMMHRFQIILFNIVIQSIFVICHLFHTFTYYQNQNIMNYYQKKIKIFKKFVKSIYYPFRPMHWRKHSHFRNLEVFVHNHTWHLLLDLEQIILKMLCNFMFTKIE